METFIIGFTWFLTSAVLSTFANQAFLMYFVARADVLTAIRFIGSALIGILSGSLFSFNSFSSQGKSISHLQIFKSFFFPALFLLLANLFNSLSLSLSGITLTYITKAAIPVITAIYCVVFLKARYSIQVYFALFVACIGVALSCYSDMDFKPIGFAAALLSTFFQVAMNISSKSAFQTHVNISGIQGQCYMAIIASCLIVPILTFKDFISLYFSMESMEFEGWWWESVSSAATMENIRILANGPVGNIRVWFENNKLALLLITAIAYHLEYVLNFLFVSKVSNLSFSLADISRRLGIVVSGTILFHKTLSFINWVGIFIALSGVLGYSILSITPSPAPASSTTATTQQALLTSTPQASNSSSERPSSTTKSGNNRKRD